MLVEQFIDDEARLNALQNITRDLLTLGAYSMLLELAASRNRALPSEKPIEDAALRSAWHNGYVEALGDLFLFKERYASQAKELPKADFNAHKKLFDRGEITDKEYEQLTGQRPTS